MQTRTYGDLFKTASALIGTGGELDVTEQDQLAQFINRRFQQAFDESLFWPRYIVIGEARDIISLTVSGLGAGSLSDDSGLVNGNYILLGQDSGENDGVAGTNVYYNPAQGTKSDVQIAGSTVIYKRNGNDRWQINTNSGIDISSSGAISADGGGGVNATEADTNKKDNPSEVVNWTIGETALSGTPLITNEQLVPYAQQGRNTIGEFISISNAKPLSRNSVTEFEFYVNTNGASIVNFNSSTTDKAFVTYKKQFTPFSVDEARYESTEEVPSEFFNFISHAVYADFLRVQNRQEQALTEEQTAQIYLIQELEKVDIRSNNNKIGKKFSTYVNRQSR
jgi:hypothetical protein|tara:strand:+ start:191 stop:1201 length:1011 start_codon:yes stop_codon:yes gene_type:complete